MTDPNMRALLEAALPCLCHGPQPVAGALGADGHYFDCPARCHNAILALAAERGDRLIRTCETCANSMEYQPEDTADPGLTVTVCERWDGLMQRRIVMPDFGCRRWTAREGEG